MTSGRSVANLFGAFKEMVAKFLKTIFKKPSLKVIFEKLHHSRHFFLYFRLFNTVLIQLMLIELPMTEFEPRVRGVGSDRSTNCVTTTAQLDCYLIQKNANG